MSETPSTDELVNMLRKGTEYLANMAKGLEVPWMPQGLGDTRKLHNMYARNLVTCYVSKFTDLSNALLLAIERSNFMAYALCGRALIETTAILRYYVTEEYKPLLDKGSLNKADMDLLLEIDDRHLRGGRFDWESFLFQRYSKLMQDVVAEKEKKSKKGIPPPPSDTVPRQASVQKCMDKWSCETPAVLMIYNLFCDLVHPNIGSNFLVASTSGEELYFSRFRGEPVGRAIFEQSFPMLLSTTHKPFGVYLTALMGTIYQDDELSK